MNAHVTPLHMCQNQLIQAGPTTTNTFCNSAVMDVSVTALCILVGLKLLSGRAPGSTQRIPGSRTLEVLLAHSDLIALLLKTSQAANGDAEHASGRKCSFPV